MTSWGPEGPDTEPEWKPGLILGRVGPWQPCGQNKSTSLFQSISLFHRLWQQKLSAYRPSPPTPGIEAAVRGPGWHLQTIWWSKWFVTGA